MGWRNWPYWVRGGIIGGIFVLIYIFLYFLGVSGDFLFRIIAFPASVFTIWSGFFAIDYCSESASSWLFKSTSLHSSCPFAKGFNVILPILLWVIIGIVLGFIIGKIKSSKKRKNAI